MHSNRLQLRPRSSRLRLVTTVTSCATHHSKFAPTMSHRPPWFMTSGFISIQMSPWGPTLRRVFLNASQLYVSFGVSIGYFPVSVGHFSRQDYGNATLAGMVSSPAAPVGPELGHVTRFLFVEVWLHHSTSLPTALAESTGEDPVQACCSHIPLSARGQHCRMLPMRSSTQLILGSGDAFDLLPHCCWMSIVHSYPLLVIGPSCCCCLYLKQSAPTCHICTLYVCFLRSSQGFPPQAFLPMTYHNFCSACTVTVVIFGHFNRSFLLFTLFWNSRAAAPDVEILADSLFTMFSICQMESRSVVQEWQSLRSQSM